jgi:hypothetical protein
LAESSGFQLTHHHDDGQLRLERWRQNVGTPVALDLSTGTMPAAHSIVVLSWNVWIGRGRLREVISRPARPAGFWSLVWVRRKMWWRLPEASA